MIEAIIFSIIVVTLFGYTGYLIWFPKCIVCKKRYGGIIKHKTIDGTSCSTSSYLTRAPGGGCATVDYHQQCFNDVIKNPERYNDRVIFSLNSVLSDLKGRKSSEKTRLDYFKKLSSELELK